MKILTNTIDESPLKYNFVVIQSGADYNRVATSDLEKRSDVKVFYELCQDNPSRFDKLLYSFFKSSKVDKYFKMPFLKRWQKKFENIEFENASKPLCFVVDVELIHARFGYDFLIFLRKRYPLAKTVGFYNDLVSTKQVGGRPEKIRSYFDLITTYDKGDAEKYGLEYYPTFFSDYCVQSNPNIESSDVYFVGAAKNRLKKILSAYMACSKAGLKCDFYLKGVKKDDRLLMPGIHYLDKNMSYVENLEHVVKSKCILEIMQEGAVGATFRLWEAINYGKLLITNNRSIKNSVFYDANYITVIENFDKIDFSFVKNCEYSENPMRNQIRPKKYLQFIQDKLDK